VLSYTRVQKPEQYQFLKPVKTNQFSKLNQPGFVNPLIHVPDSMPAWSTKKDDIG
jgi:hypothetical protein